MAINYTEEQLNSVDKSFLIQLLLQQQEQLNALTKELHVSNEKMQEKYLNQIRKCFKYPEKRLIIEIISFWEKALWTV